ncbi:hypothetical protein [Roseovarius sp. Pro17]|uniref:hypothetical protein n=1 Tax=Roseovarius sp. Pro17 TaxID=3108175 RepID=UPI002D78A9F0|nr:hypothetical protein [Roseovarius sp. Pro17]
MPNYILAYHGGKKPESPEAGQKFMARWREWSDGLGDASIEKGKPAGMSKTVSADGVADNGGSNPLSGYSIVRADNIDGAVKLAQGCPHLDHGTIEVAELMDMEM